MYSLRFAYLPLLYVLIPLYCLVLVYRLWFYRGVVYRYSLTEYLAHHGRSVASNFGKYFLLFSRAAQLLVVMLLIARPQWVDKKTNVNVHGVDIIVALDVSGSMHAIDDLQDPRVRIDVAKAEAVKFVEKRPDDQIGVVIFAADALSLCPLTLDKTMLIDSINQLRVGYIPADGTALGTGLATAVNRLRTSQAKSKIIILLTDGKPMGEEKVSPPQAVELARNFGIKIYTIAIGNENGGYFRTFAGWASGGPDMIDKQLLKMIADQTGGRFFEAQRPEKLREIYSTIDKLERTEYQTDIFHRYYEAYQQFIWIFIVLLVLELLGRLLIWRGL